MSSSSYFDAQPAKAQPPAALLDIPEGSDFARTGLLSPQVSRILDDLDLEEKSNSDDNDDASHSGENSIPERSTSGDRKSRRDLAEQHHKAQPTPIPRGNKQGSTHNKSSKPRPGFNSEKQPHFARFHSLRSMLFSNQIEGDIKKHNESKMHEEAEAKWKAQHDSRRGFNRPKTPEKPSSSKDGLGQKMKAGLKRMASKDSPPPMVRIPEDNASTASDDEEVRVDQSDEERINHSDIEDLVRWVSRRDPPSDGEAHRLRSLDAKRNSKKDSGHESLGHSDVEELVRWVSRKDGSQPKDSKAQDPQPQEAEKFLAVPSVVPHGYSDASTESDSDMEARAPRSKESMDEDDVDELVRWVSRKEGPNAGPVREKKGGSSTGTRSDSAELDSNNDELRRWVTKRDDTSGESLYGSQESIPVVSEPAQGSEPAALTGSGLKQEISPGELAKKLGTMERDTVLTNEDVDELVRWVSRKKSDVPKVEQ